MNDHLTAGRAIIDASLYMVLGTADRSGAPWVSPVYFAPDGYRDFLWVSKPGARHSINIAARADVSIVVFDSSVPIGHGQGVYMAAVAEKLAGDEAGRDERGIETFSRRIAGPRRRRLGHRRREGTEPPPPLPGAGDRAVRPRRA